MLAALLAQDDGGGAVGGVIGVIIWVGLFVLWLVAYWKLFEKLGLPGWMGIVPFVNVYQLFKLRGEREPVLWLILFLVPCINIIALWFLASDTAELFGKSLGWKLALFFLPGISHLVLAFGDSQGDPSAMRGRNPAV
jgi:hypothetical protein